LAFRFDRQRRTPNTVDAHRLVRHAGEAGGTATQGAVAEALFRAYFQDGRDIGDVAVLAEVAAKAGLKGAADLLASDAGAAEVREEDAGFRRLGISGVPSFALAGHVLFSGAVPAERMADAFRRALAILRERAQ
jgi:predicted DsbA family dithiol-disulfide isomerase